MSNISKSAALLLSCFCVISLSAQPLSKADKTDIDNSTEAWGKVFETWNAGALGPFFTDNAEVVTPRGEIVRGRDNLVTLYTGLFQYFSAQPKPDRTEVKKTSQNERYLTPDLVLVSFLDETTFFFGANKKVEKMAYSILWRKTKGKWLAEQVTLTPAGDGQAAPGN